MSKPGSRVMAIRNVEDKTVYYFGAGVYEGDFPMPGSDSGPGEADRAVLEKVIRDGMTEAGLEKQMRFTEGLLRWTLPGEEPLTEEQIQTDLEKARASYLERTQRPFDEQVRELWELSNKNPRIALDDGGYTWGFECWWGDEDAARNKYPETEYTWIQVAPKYATAS